MNEELVNNDVRRYYRDGIELEKGVVLTEERIIEHEDLYRKYCEFFTAYPDLSK